MRASATVAGERVTGIGTAGIHYAYSQGSCTGHVGLGTVSVGIPTTGGIKHIEGTLHVKRTALVVQAVADFPGARFTGLGVVIPTQGTCLLTPLTRGDGRRDRRAQRNVAPRRYSSASQM